MARLPLTDTAFFRTARERFKLANDSDANQAEREREDLAFYADEQWPADILKARNGQAATEGKNAMPGVPARPVLVINKVKEPVRQIQNQIRASDIGFELVPADDFGDLGITPDDTEITLREGLVRRIQREPHAQDARQWAADRAFIAGSGYYLVMTRYLPGKTSDQEIYLHKIYNQAGVKLDPSREQSDGSDADWGFIGTWMPWDRYKATYPNTIRESGEYTKSNPFAEYSEADFIGLTEDFPDWYKSTGKDRAVRVVDYWYTERTSRVLCTLDDGSDVWEDEVPEDVEPVDRRTVCETQIKFCKIGGGIQKLEETDWPTADFPIVEIVGEELQPYDAERRRIGIVRPARSSNMGFNYMVSKQVETIGLTPIPALQVDPEAIDGYEAWYAVANTRTLPYLPYRTYDDQGRPLKEPHRPAVDPNILAIAQSIALFDAAVKSTTAVPDPTLGNVDPSLKSGKAIQAVVQNAAQSTSNFLDNYTRAVRREAVIINNLLYPIYGTKPGRLVRIVTGEGESQAMRVATEPQAGPMASGPAMPQPGQMPGQMPGAMPPMAMPTGPMSGQTPNAAQQAQKVAKLTKDAHFNVIVKVTKNYESRRTEEASTLGQLIAANPEFMTWYGDLFFKNADFPGHAALAERAKVMLAPPIQQMLQAQANGQAFDPAAQAKIMQLQQQVQHAEAAMQQLAEEAKGKKLDYQKAVDVEKIQQDGDVQKMQIQTDHDYRMQVLKNAGAITVADVNAAAKGAQQRDQAVVEALALDQQHAHEAIQAELDRQHEQQQASQQMAHQGGMAAAQAGQQGDQQQAAFQQESQQADADRALQQQQLAQQPADSGGGA